MACVSPSLTIESNYATLSTSTASGSETDGGRKPFRRRHSSFHPKRRTSSLSLDSDDSILLKVDLFLNELGRRLDFIDKYGSQTVDAGINRAYATLQAVRARCSQVSGEFIDAGRRRAKIMVETVESRYQDALAAKETLNEKTYTGLMLLEDMLSDYESRALKLRDQGFAAAAETLMDEGRRVINEGIESVHGRLERAQSVAQGVVDEGIERISRRVTQAAESLEESIERAISRAKEYGLITYEELPVPWRVNPHIVKGYRFSNSKIECVCSAFKPSNELVNIWSHAIGLFIVLSIAFYFYPTSENFPLSTKTDVFIAAVFFFAACKCLVCSCLWHTMNSVADQTLMERFACVDYTGISLLIAASIMTTEYTAFYCEPVSRWIYLTTTATLGIGGVILPWHPTFNRQDMAWARVAFYSSLAATGFLPILQLNYTRGGAWAWEFYAPIAKSIAVYGVGAFVYASQVPERWCPGAFDYVGGSHNLWHFAVLGGILFHYVAMQEFFAGAFERAATECAAF